MRSIVMSMSVCLFGCLFARITRIGLLTHGRTLQFFCARCLWLWLDPLLTALRYVAGFMDDVTFVYRWICGWSWACQHQWTWPRAAAAHWLAGSAGRLAGARWPGRTLAVWQLDLTASGDGCARFAMCLMLVSCALWQSVLSMIAFFSTTIIASNSIFSIFK